MAEMTSNSPPGGPIIEWGWAGRALDGPSGDLHVVVPFDGGTLVALLDGLGHGDAAAAASQTAVPVLEAHASEPVARLVQRCHEALRGTRGAVMTLASFDARDASLAWTGVGNVDAILRRVRDDRQRRDEAISTRGGVVGYRLPPLKTDRFPLSRGDTLVMATDGIRSNFSAGLTMEYSPQEIAESILVRYGKDSDDAHVVVARYLGAGS
jgi:serine/threonine protein phosphatase PrpC